MRLRLLPVLATMREIYAMPRDMARFKAYLGKMQGGTSDVVLPIMGANPMAKEHMLRFVDTLLAAKAEDVVARALAEAERRLAHVDLALNVALVPMDDQGGWTDREMNEAQNRFGHQAALRRGFTTVYAWASDPVDAAGLHEEARAQVYRAAHAARHGDAKDLEALLVQEGRTLRFARTLLPPPDPTTRANVLVHLKDRHISELFAAMYGDASAQRVGHAPLGVAPRGGWQVALERAMGENERPESLL